MPNISCCNRSMIICKKITNHSKIIVDGDCSHEIKRCLLLGRKVRQHIKKQSHHFADMGQCSQSYGFSSSHVWMWELDHKEGLALKNWYFWIVVLEKTLESHLDCKEIKSINPKGNQPYSLEGLMLKLQYFGHLVQRADSLEKTQMLGKTEGRRRRGQQRMRWLDGITDLRDMSLSQLWEDSEGPGRLACVVHAVVKSQTQLSNLTTNYKWCISGFYINCHLFFLWVSGSEIFYTI